MPFGNDIDESIRCSFETADACGWSPDSTAKFAWRRLEADKVDKDIKLVISRDRTSNLVYDTGRQTKVTINVQ